MVENDSGSYHLDRLDGPRGEMIQNGIKSNHFDRLGVPGCAMTGRSDARRFTGLSHWAAQVAKLF